MNRIPISIALVASLTLLTPLVTCSKPTHPNIVLITIDTLRADHLGCYGKTDIQTPNIDELAREGVLFETCVADAPVTLPSHASIMTGTYTIFHGVHDNGLFQLNAGATTLAETLSSKGYQTAAFVSARVLSDKYGLAQGFDHYDCQMPTKAEYLMSIPERRAQATTDAVMHWIENKHDQSKPLFLWIHYFDPHAEYAPPEPFKSQYPEHPYSGEIAYVDQQIGRLMDHLSEAGLTDHAITVITSDHGESLGEHGEEHHGFFIYDAAVMVPLVIHQAPKTVSGQSVSELVRTIDIMPTVLDLIDVSPANSDIQGQSLRPLMSDSHQELPRVAYIETQVPQHQFNWAPLFGIRTQNHKFIQAPKPELYDLRTDAAELNNIIEAQADRAESLKSDLSALIERFESNANRPGESRTPIDLEELEKLRSLGYLFSNYDDGAEDHQRPDPKDLIHVIELIDDGNHFLFKRHEPRMAQGIFRMALQSDPNNPIAFRYLTLSLLADRRYELALNTIQDMRARLAEGFNLRELDMYDHILLYLRDNHLIADAMEQLKLLQSKADIPYGANEFLGTLCEATGRIKAAESAYRRAVQNQGNEFARFKLASLLARRNRHDEAFSEFLRLSEVFPQEAAIHHKLSSAYFSRTEYKNALKHLKIAQELGFVVPIEQLEQLEQVAAQESEAGSPDAEVNP